MSRYGKKHGLYKSNEYTIWIGIKARCYNKKDPSYHNYGGRGIKMDNRWLGENGFINFYNDMGMRPSLKHSVERINNDKNYGNTNCRWATSLEQNSNTRTNRWYEYNGKKMILARWTESINANTSNFCQMLKRKNFKDTFEFYKNGGRFLKRNIK